VRLRTPVDQRRVRRQQRCDRHRLTVDLHHRPPRGHGLPADQPHRGYVVCRAPAHERRRHADDAPPLPSSGHAAVDRDERLRHRAERLLSCAAASPDRRHAGAARRLHRDHADRHLGRPHPRPLVPDRAGLQRRHRHPHVRCRRLQGLPRRCDVRRHPVLEHQRLQPRRAQRTTTSASTRPRPTTPPPTTRPPPPARPPSTTSTSRTGRPPGSAPATPSPWSRSAAGSRPTTPRPRRSSTG
jgi:hypothetical protein